MNRPNEHLANTLNDLIRINNDRIEGYQKAIEITDDPGLKSMFKELAVNSSQNIDELTEHLFERNDKAAENSTVSGSLYRTWMEIKSKFTGNSAHSLLADCEYREDMALKTYEELDEDDDLILDETTQQMLDRQRERIKYGHDQVKKLRDLTARENS